MRYTGPVKSVLWGMVAGLVVLLVASTSMAAPSFKDRLEAQKHAAEGKKLVAQGVFYDAMDEVAKKIADVPVVEVFETAVNNVKPYVEVR